MATPNSQAPPIYQTMAAYEGLRKTLLAKKYAERLEQPLAFWALPSDKGLPHVFLGSTLAKLLQVPFGELLGTPGVGQKKMWALVKLMQRATQDDLPLPVTQELASHNTLVETAHTSGRQSFDVAGVSESQWARWCHTVKRHHLEQHTLGQLAVSLQDLPTVAWLTPLDQYLDHTLLEIRQFKIHGAKRVAVILEVFHAVEAALGSVPSDEHIAVQLAPRRMVAVGNWVAKVLRASRVPLHAEISLECVTPLLDQLLIDLGPAVQQLAETRLGVGGPPHEVRQQAKRLGVTRARIYQHFNECRQALGARWPAGGERMAALCAALQQRGWRGRERELLLAVQEMLFGSGLPNETEVN